MKIAILDGSTRENSTSFMLCQYIQRVMESKGAEVGLFDLYTHPLPLYYADDTEEDNANLREMKKLLIEADAIVLSTPEYHGSLSGQLKNALDYTGKQQFDNKLVLAVSSSGGAIGISSLQHIQTIVRNVHGINCTEWISIGGEDRGFTAEGDPVEVKIKDRVHRVVAYFLSMAEKLRKD